MITAVRPAAPTASAIFNVAEGASSFAAGNYASALHDGAFVWSSYLARAQSFAANRFHIFGYNGMSVDYLDQRPGGGGARWVYIGPQIAGQTIATWTGLAFRRRRLEQCFGSTTMMTKFTLASVWLVLVRNP